MSAITLLDTAGYRFMSQPRALTISKKVYNSVFLLVLSMLAGAALLIAGPLLDFRLMLLGISLIGVPFVIGKWHFPNKIEVDRQSQTVKLRFGTLMSYNSDVLFSEIKKINVTKEVKTSDVSAMQEGFEDFVYEFRIETTHNKQLKLLKLVLRKEEEQCIGQILILLNQELKIKPE
ncbi:MAG: hypothetical protein AAFX87_01600 [Bacteroidota bacterium]